MYSVPHVTHASVSVRTAINCELPVVKSKVWLCKYALIFNRLNIVISTSNEYPLSVLHDRSIHRLLRFRRYDISLRKSIGLGKVVGVCS